MAGAGTTGGWIATEGGRKMWWMANCAASIDPGMWHPKFGTECPVNVLSVQSIGGAVITTFSWAQS